MRFGFAPIFSKKAASLNANKKRFFFNRLNNTEINKKERNISVLLKIFVDNCFEQAEILV